MSFRTFSILFFHIAGGVALFGAGVSNDVQIVFNVHTNINRNNEGVSIDYGLRNTASNRFTLWLPKEERGISIETFNTEGRLEKSFGAKVKNLAKMTPKSQKDVRGRFIPYVLSPGEAVWLDNWTLCDHIKDTNGNYSVRLSAFGFRQVQQDFHPVTISQQVNSLKCVR